MERHEVFYRKILICILSSFLFLGFSLVSVRDTAAQEQMLRMYYHILNFPSEDPNKTQLRFFVQVPYDDLLFIKDNETYKARYDLTLAAWKEKEIVLNKSHEKNVRVSTYEETNSENQLSTVEESLSLEPGEYKVKIILTDLESEADVSTEHKIEVHDYSDKKLKVSDIVLLSKMDILEDSPFPKLHINHLGNLAADDSTLLGYVEIYSPNIDSEVEITYNIIDGLCGDESQVFKKGRLNLIKKKEREFFFLDLGDLGLQMGLYVLALQIKEGGEVLQLAKNFSVSWEGLPRSIDDFDLAVKQLKYIASKKEMKKIENSHGIEKINAFREYWESKDPAPEIKGNKLLEEYYRRVQYATEHFSTFRRNNGWNTDMGWIYILMGHPDEFERHPFEAGSRPYEIWYYYVRNRMYVFVDYSNYGEYRLESYFDPNDSDILKAIN